VSAIVTGHVAAVWRAHRQALVLFATPRAALKSQYAMTTLMVAYTVVSLTILAAPIVESRSAGPIEADAAPATVEVPADALLPEPGTGSLRAVGPGRTARAGLTFRALASAFHDGTRMTVADLLYPYSFAWRWSAGEAADPEIAAATALARERLVGLRVVGSDTTSKSITFADITFTRELLIVELYADVAAADPDRAAAILPPWSALPWPVIVLMEEAATRGWAAFSRSEAVRRGIPWLDLVRTPEVNQRLADLVGEFARTGYRPEALAAFVTAEEARARWTALDAFYKAHRHFLVTNGPYQLKEWSLDAVTLEAFRDLTYPLGVGSFDALPIPRRGFIARVEATPDGLDLAVEIEVLRKFQRSYSLTRETLRAVPSGPGLTGPLDLACRYVVIGAAGDVALAGTAGLAPDATFRLALKGQLPPGTYTVLASVILNDNAVNAEVTRIPYAVPAE
jgi:hypothetical protein